MLMYKLLKNLVGFFMYCQWSLGVLALEIFTWPVLLKQKAKPLLLLENPGAKSGTEE